MLTVVSTFSGCGGSCLGFKQAGWKHLLAAEFVAEARATYEVNFPGVYVYPGDVRELSAERVLSLAGLRVGELDCLEGSPPCSSYSAAGIGSRGWGREKHYSTGRAQRTDDLFDHFLRLAEGLRPRSIVAENVAGIARGASKGVLLSILDRLRELGYRPGARLLDASWLGVPQARRRVIVVAIREDVGSEPPFPLPEGRQRTLREALAGVEPTDAERAEVDISRFAIGREWHRTPVGGPSERYFSLVRPDPDKPCPTITATTGSLGAAGVCHPTECRKLTARELRRVCGFPDDFVLTGTYEQQAERLGRAVPPPMMRAVAAALARDLEGRA